VPVKIYTVDAFTEQPFGGNPAAVCILDEEWEGRWLQNVAAEMNLSETAFLWRQADHWRLRWFTPTVEVDLCGHATLAGAHILWERGYAEKGSTLRFETKSGLLKANVDGKWIELDFPSEPPITSPVPRALLDALRVEPLYTGKNRFDYLIEIGSEDELRRLDPDYGLLKTIPTRGTIVTSSPSTRGYDFVSRFFAPSSGVDEDPVTGSTAYQASKRGGLLRIRVAGDRTHIAGRALTVMVGELIARH
jgi:PhzF family phenazine biosynthesis protein